MARRIVEAVRAWGSLAVEGETQPAFAWDEDLTTLCIEAASALPLAGLRHALASPKLHAPTLAAALDLRVPLRVAADPMGLSADLDGPTLLLGGEEAFAVACLVDGAPGPVEAKGAPRDLPRRTMRVSPLRALQESRRVPPPEPIPDGPMGAYVPPGTWMEDLPARLRLVAQKCEGCGKALYPPRGACPACRGRAFAPLPLPREAQVYAATRIGRGGAPSEFALEQAQVGAYWVGVVSWPEHGVKVTARLSGFDEEGPVIGQKVRPVVRRLFEQEGAVRYGTKFAPP